MSKHRIEKTDREAEELAARRKPLGRCESGVICKDIVERIHQALEASAWAPGEDPPWPVVDRYLTLGEQADRIEEHARRSPAFATVLRALRNARDDEDEQEPSSRSRHLRLVK